MISSAVGTTDRRFTLSRLMVKGKLRKRIGLENKQGSPHNSSPVLVRDTDGKNFFMAADSGVVSCLDAKSSV